MKTMHPLMTAALAAALLAAGEARGATLKVGDPAPKLQTGAWVQGEPVTALASGTVYLVEFWATWCGPCRMTIPHLNELHTKFKDQGLVVIGQNCWERDETLVAPFIKTMGEKMTYRVAMDNKTDKSRGAMAETWMAAAERSGIPSAFLVDKTGRLAWIGHPSEIDDAMIKDLLAGTFDAQKIAAAQEERAKEQTKISGLYRNVYSAIRTGDWAKAEAALGELDKAVPESQRYRADSLRVDLLLGKGEHNAAAALATKTSEANKETIAVQMTLAMQLSRAKDPKPAVLDAAEAIALRAQTLAGKDDLFSLSTLARIAFLKGNKDRAVELQSQVVEKSDERAKPRMTEMLEAYKAGRLPEEAARAAVRPAAPAPAPKAAP